MKEKTITGCACGTHLSGIIDKEGKLYLFGVIDLDDLVDKQTGTHTVHVHVQYMQTHAINMYSTCNKHVQYMQ